MLQMNNDNSWSKMHRDKRPAGSPKRYLNSFLRNTINNIPNGFVYRLAPGFSDRIFT